MEHYTVRITLTMDLDVDAESTNKAIEQAKDYVNGCDFGEMRDVGWIAMSVSDRKVE